MQRSINSSLLTGAVLLAIALAACNGKKSRIYTVGVINVVPVLDQTLTGFKEGMTNLGYIEGETIRYLYHGPTTEMNELSAVARSLLTAEVDLILTITTPATQAAKEATVGIGLPVVFAIVTDPVGAGIVRSMRQPGGNVTGVTFGSQEARRLEWLLRIAPEIRKIYVPFNPKDKSPVLALKTVRNAATKLGLELITREVHDPEMLNDAVLNLPAEADAVFLLPDSSTTTRLPDFVAAAIARRLPISGPNISNVKNDQVLVSFGVDQHLAGKQSARMVDQILKGAKPADLPVETVEFYLAINLKTAKAIGLTIPGEILRHAHVIVR